MLSAYHDRGARLDAAWSMCVSAAILKPARYKQFVRAWNSILADIPGGPVAAFHPPDFFSGAGVFRGARQDVRAYIARAIPVTAFQLA